MEARNPCRTAPVALFRDRRRRNALRPGRRAPRDDAAAVVAGNPRAGGHARRRAVRAHEAFGRADAGRRRTCCRKCGACWRAPMRCVRSRRSLARGEAGVLSLAFVSTADYGLLPLLLRDFGARYPGVRLQLTEATSDVQIEELVAGRIDAGLVIPPLPPRHAAALSYLPIAREPLVIAHVAVDAARASSGRARASGRTRPSACSELADPCRSSSSRDVSRPVSMTSLWVATARPASRRASGRRRSRCRPS